MAKGKRRNEDHEEEAREHLNGQAPLNSAARAEIIQEAHATITDFEKQIKGLKTVGGVADPDQGRGPPAR